MFTVDVKQQYNNNKTQDRVARSTQSNAAIVNKRRGIILSNIELSIVAEFIIVTSIYSCRLILSASAYFVDNLNNF